MHFVMQSGYVAGDHRRFERCAMDTKFSPTTYFNSLSESEKKSVLENGLGPEILNDGLRFALPIWWIFQGHSDTFGLRNGSAFLIDLGRGILAVTAAHVLREYCENKRTAQAIGCQLGNALFDPEAHLIDCNDDLDIATFRISAKMLGQIDKPILHPDPPNWASLNPAENEFAFFAGFPAQGRGITPTGRMFAAVPYFAMPPITRVTDRQITCRFERDKMIDFSGSGLPPQGYDIGGVSGGPMLMPTLTDHGIIWRFAGVIVEAAAGALFEQVVAVRATFIQPNGRIG
jgi:hypothetical protein